jgi:hypothetical protein
VICCLQFLLRGLDWVAQRLEFLGGFDLTLQGLEPLRGQEWWSHQLRFVGGVESLVLCLTFLDGLDLLVRCLKRPRVVDLRSHEGFALLGGLDSLRHDSKPLLYLRK